MKMKNRVVVTGLGVCSPIGTGIAEFTDSLRNLRSGIKFHPQLEELNFQCQIAGQPEVSEALKRQYFTDLQLKDLESTGIVYGMIAGVDAWQDAGLQATEENQVDYDSGVIFGTSLLGADKFRKAIYLTDEGKVKRLGSTTVIQTMASGISAYLGGKLGLGNQITTNSSACTTGTESILMGYERIQSGKAVRMLVGGCNDSGPYIWGGFDAMRVLEKRYNQDPSAGSRPMASDARGFVPGSGAGALILESLASALDRGAKIYGEIKGGAVNSGGQRGEGSMTAPNSEAVQRCIKEAVLAADIHANDIDHINGHLTATGMCPREIQNWSQALDRQGADFPYVNSLKSLTGHCLAAAGSIESVATFIELDKGFIFGNLNAEHLHEEVLSTLSRKRVPLKTIPFAPRVIAKASFGFGDVNCCMIYQKYEKES